MNRLWRIFRGKESLGIFEAKDEAGALSLAKRAGRVAEGEIGLRVARARPQRSRRDGSEPSTGATMEATVVRLNVGATEAARVLIVTSDALLGLSVRGAIAKHFDSLGEAVEGPAIGDGIRPRPVEALSLRVVSGKHERVRFYVLGKDAALREEIADYIASRIKPGPRGKLERGNSVVTVGGPA